MKQYYQSLARKEDTRNCTQMDGWLFQKKMMTMTPQPFVKVVYTGTANIINVKTCFCHDRQPIGMKTAQFIALAILLVLIVDLSDFVAAGRVQYQYKKYTYRKKRDDKIYKNQKQPCEVNPDCLVKRGADQAICIRKCISEFCYQDIYAADELEQGEIDVRLNSFKGCVSQRK